MKLIAIASEDDKGLEGQVSPHFGRCSFFTLVEVDEEQIALQRIEINPHAEQHKPGLVPQLIRSLGANVILAGAMGPRAVSLFQRYGIEVATGARGTVGQALAAYLGGNMKGIVPCQHDHPGSCGEHRAGESCADPHAQTRGMKRAGHETPLRAAIPAVNASGLSAAMESRFGRAPYFVLVDLRSGVVLGALPNTAWGDEHGAGTSAAKLLRVNSVNTVIAGRLGPKAIQVLKTFGIELWSVPEGLTVGQALERLRTGELVRASQGAP